MPTPMILSEAAAEGRTVPAFRAVFQRQKAYFATDATKPYERKLAEHAEEPAIVALARSAFLH